MFDLVRLFDQYGILEITASYLSTIDLYNTARASPDLYYLIRKPDEKFRRFKHQALCDGSGYVLLELFLLIQALTKTSEI